VAPLRRFSRQGRFQQTSQRKTGWSIGPNGIISRSSTGTSLFPTAVQSLLDGQTIVRLRGELQARLTSADAVNSGLENAIGFCRVTEEAFNAGVASVPSPITDADWDGWMYHRYFTLKASAAADLTGPSSGVAIRLEIDSKAMRKLALSDVLVAVVESVESGTAVEQMDLRTRVLLKLP